jgi:hypothetical protein
MPTALVANAVHGYWLRPTNGRIHLALAEQSEAPKGEGGEAVGARGTYGLVALGNRVTGCALVLRTGGHVGSWARAVM